MNDDSSSVIDLVFNQADLVDPHEQWRLDQYLTAKLPQFSRAHIQKLIAQGMVLLDGRAGKASHRLKAGQMISVNVPPVKNLAIKAEQIPLKILYEDKHLAVIDKPAGMVTHPGAGKESGTLVHALLHHMQGSLSGIGGVLRPGIVHRLDKDTSGLMVVAKDDLTHRQLARQIQTKIAKRTYLALLEGDLKKDSGSIQAPIGRHPTKRTKMAVVAHGKKAASHFTILRRAKPFLLAQIELETGRTHQIRVHMASLNCPVVGDLLYNQKTTGTLKARQRLGLTGQALHATKLSFFHPHTARLLEFETGLPDDLKNLLDRLFKED
jgi:23S rRNA pseudouridine1911/1915/1917 synthase